MIEENKKILPTSKLPFWQPAWLVFLQHFQLRWDMGNWYWVRTLLRNKLAELKASDPPPRGRRPQSLPANFVRPPIASEEAGGGTGRDLDIWSGPERIRLRGGAAICLGTKSPARKSTRNLSLATCSAWFTGISGRNMRSLGVPVNLERGGSWTQDLVIECMLGGHDLKAICLK